MKRFQRLVSSIHTRHNTHEKQKSAIFTRLDLSSKELKGIERGHALMDSLRYHMDMLEEVMPRTEGQIVIHEKILAAVSQCIYGNDLYANEAKIKAYNQFQDIYNGCLLTAPRRFGKTLTIAMICAIMFIVLPGIEISIVTQSALSAGTQSGILGKIKSILSTVFGFDKYDGVENRSCIMATFGNGDSRKISSYSGGAGNSLRGIGGSVIILEEAAYINEEVIKQVILPILSRNESCLLGMSTLDAVPTNIFTKMLESGYFYTYRVQYICEDCIKLGICVPCVHNAHMVPFWQGNKTGLIKAICGDDDEDMLRENMGVMDSPSNLCFSKHTVDELMCQPRCEIFEPVRHVFSAIDPCVGSLDKENRTSDFAIVSICNPATTIIGMDAFDAVRPEDYETKLVDHFRKIRSMPYFETATLVVDVESGTGMEASHIQAHIRPLGNVIFVNRDAQRKDGSVTSKDVKIDAMAITRRLLDERDVRIAKNVVTSSSTPAKMWIEFADQMKRYERIIKQGKTIHDRTSVVLTGKGLHKKVRDDMCMTTQRALYCRHQFMINPKNSRIPRQ